MNWIALPVVSVAMTVATYALGLKLHLRWRWIPPILVAAAPIIVLLVLVHEPFADYNRGGAWITWLLGPGTVALAIPMYRNGVVLRSALPRLFLSILIGSIAGMLSAGVVAWAFGAPRAIILSTLPKSITTPIAIEVSRELGGIPSITTMMVVVTGVLGASIGVPLLKALRVRDGHAVGAAMGTAAHGIGTASLVRRSERSAAVSSWAMAAAGIITSVLAALLKFFLK